MTLTFALLLAMRGPSDDLQWLCTALVSGFVRPVHRIGSKMRSRV